MQDRGPSAYIAEFIGTFLLVLSVTLVLSNFVFTDPAVFRDFGVIALVHVLILFVLIQTLAVASGAHFNPAVTVTMVALRQIKLIDAAIYIVVQLAGAVAGALVTKLLMTDFDNAEDINYGATAVSDRLDGSIPLGMLAEGLGTFLLVFVIVGVALNPQGAKEWAGLAIGGALGVAVMIFGPLSGAGLNPARSFGPALVSGEWGGADEFLLVYVAAPVIGAVLAGFLYWRIYITPGKKEPGGLGPVG